MPLFCVQCAMKAMLANDKPPVFDETLEAHVLRLHPNMEATIRERVSMEEALAEKLLALALFDDDHPSNKVVH